MLHSPVDQNKFREILFRPSVAREFFLPYELARWDGESYTLGAAKFPGSQISGVRLQAADPNDPNHRAEAECQSDLQKLVVSLGEIRQEKTLAGAVLSKEVLLDNQAGSDCKRVRFGMFLPSDGRFLDDSRAAEECHHQICRAIAKGRLRVDRPGPFDPKTGMKGLEQWAGAVRLSRNPWPFPPQWLWLLLLPLLLLLAYLLFPGGDRPAPLAPQPSTEQPQDVFAGKAVNTDSFVILLDKSASMQPFFSQIRDEAKRLLNSRITRPNTKSYADLIVYDQSARSALGDMMEVNDRVADRLVAYIDNLQAGGGTNLESAIQKSGTWVQKHGKETTLLIVTDGDDPSISSMLQEPGKVMGYFGNTKVSAQWITPRLLQPGADPGPQGNRETSLQQFVDIVRKP